MARGGMKKYEAFYDAYDNREEAHKVALLQLMLMACGLIFTYSVWWLSFVGIAVAIMGYYGTSLPVVGNKVPFVVFHFYGSFILLLLESLAVILFLVDRVEALYDPKNNASHSWIGTTLLFGTMVIFGHVFVTVQALYRSGEFRAEIMRSPPPDRLVMTEPLMVDSLLNSKGEANESSAQSAA